MSADPGPLEVNGRPVERASIPDDERLLDTLRWRLGLKGTKEGCRSGDCGACTVLLAGETVLSCLALTRDLPALPVTTIEGIEEDPVAIAVREAFTAEAALQCGYCTPGFVVATVGLLKELGPDVGVDRLREELAGNLCRCTGYAAIDRAIRRLARGGP